MTARVLPASAASPAEAGAGRPLALSAGHFRCVAKRGFGDGRNSYAWGCAWFKNHLYVGTNRHMLVLMKARFPYTVPTEVWPVRMPASVFDLDLAGEVWRYDVDADVWKRVYKSPMTIGTNDKPVPVAYGFRNMGVFQGKSDREPVLYTIPSCGSYGQGPVLLRCEDGEHFEQVSKPGLGLDDPNVVSYRGVVPFKGNLFITPSGSRGGLCNEAFNTSVLCTDDPLSQRWHVSNPPFFGDPTNRGIFDLGVANGFLYAGTINVRHGAQLWKTDGEGPPPHRWTLVADRGFDRGPHDEMVLCFAEHRGALYVGTGIQNGGHDRINNVGRAACEIVRVWPDDRFELVMGEPRMTRFGFQSPTSGLGPGFDNFFAGYLWRLRAHEGALYAGTFDVASFLPYADRNAWDERVRRLIDPVTLERYLELKGGAELWRTVDGDDWTPVTRNGFGNVYNYGIRALLSTPRGFFVGTANPFGPEVAVKGPNGWRYEDNPRGGIEIWHGSFDHHGEGDPVAEEIALAGGFELEAVVREPTLPAGVELPLGGESTDVVGGEAFLDGLIADVAHRAADEQGGAVERGRDPQIALAGLGPDPIAPAFAVTAEIDAYFVGTAMRQAGLWRRGGAGLRNVGAWREDVSTPAQAAEAMVSELVRRVAAPEPGATPTRILVVGTGPEDLERIAGRERPDARIAALAAAPSGRLPVADESFDALVWIEGLHAARRGGALREVLRVLRPGGDLVASDLLSGRLGGDLEAEALLPAADREAVLGGYARELEAAGLSEIRLIDVTREGWERFYHHSRQFFATKTLLQQLDAAQCAEVLALLPGGSGVVVAHALVHARRPVAPRGRGGR
ncbi:MAG: class I SAM-dependent methyltransferase [bacterium]